MTDREAITELLCAYAVVSEEYKRAIDKANEALEKQIPKKPKIEKRFLELTIGKCSCGASCDSDMKYCNDCGQKIDWSDSND